MSVEWVVGGTTVDHATLDENITTKRGTEITLSVAISSQSGYETLRDYLIVPGDSAVRRGTTDKGIPWFRERVAAAAPVNDYLVEITTGDRVADIPDFWGLIVDGEDVTNPLSEFHELELTVFVVALSANYATASDVRNEFEDER